MKQVAFVVPWFGRELVGGAEQHFYQVVTRLAQRGHRVEVLTTCARAFQDDWAVNHHPEGSSESAGVTVRRFPVRARNAAAFGAANSEFMAMNDRLKAVGVNPVSESAAQAFVEENIHSPKLLDYIEAKRDDYAAFVFGPYLYGPTLLGVARAADRAVIQPLLHDETYAYLPAVEEMFHQARRLFFISEGEAMLAARLFGPSVWRKGTVTGGGSEASLQAESSAGVAALAPRSFVLCLGRRDQTKNTDLLLRAFQSYRMARPGSALQLVLAGPGGLPWPEALQGGVVDLGLVTEADKAWLLASCRALVQPSRNESYSRTIMEAWFHARPVIVHDDCLATSIAVASSSGGWTATGESEWAGLFATIEDADEGGLRARGLQGRTYAREHADWDKAIDRYEQALQLKSPKRTGLRRFRARPRAVHQMTPDLAYGDAISNQLVFLKEVLRDLGFQSQIFVQNLHEPMRQFGKVFASGAIGPDDVLLYHHSIGSELTPHAVNHPGPKALLYHNITPAHFFEPWDPPFAKLLDEGRRDLAKLASAFPVSVGDSAYNAAELNRDGFHEPGVLPIVVDPLRWATRADPALMRTLQDGRTNLLFVGRLAPNKCQHHLLEAFAEYLGYNPDARLVMVGGWHDGQLYPQYVLERIKRLGLASNVLMLRGASEAQLLACYRTAHLYVSMSEHEGLGVPLVEAMWFEVPVLAYRSSAIPETLEKAGIMFTQKQWPELAALIDSLIQERPLRKLVLKAQRARRNAFLLESILPSFLQMLRNVDGLDGKQLSPVGAAAS